MGVCMDVWIAVDRDKDLEVGREELSFDIYDRVDVVRHYVTESVNSNEFMSFYPRVFVGKSEPLPEGCINTGGDIGGMGGRFPQI